MPANEKGQPYWDPYDVEITENPYPVYKRLREGAPLYYNEQHDFYAVSRFADVERGLLDKDTFSSSRGDILEIIKSNVPMPPGVFIMEDPPQHTAHRSILTGVFTPKKMNALEGKVRELAARILDPLVGAGEFDFIADLGARIPMKVIGDLLGIPDSDLSAVRESVDANLRPEAGKPLQYSEGQVASAPIFEQYIDWRAEHPSDDLMTQLLNVEFKDETGTVRRLSRQEVLTFVNIIAGAGNETTNRLIGWTGKVLAEHPVQRRELVENPALITNAIDELLRYEPPGPHIARYVAKDVELYGQKVPAGSAMMFIVASGNRDERQYPDGDRFDIHRKVGSHLTFGRGIHFCLGSALARMEGRVVLEELLKRFPEWHVDLANAKLVPTSTTRGWETLPAYTDRARRTKTKETQQKQKTSGAATDIDGTWNCSMNTPMGKQDLQIVLTRTGSQITGKLSAPIGEAKVQDGKVTGDEATWKCAVTKPMAITLEFKAKVSGDTLLGEAKLGFFGKASFSGKRA